MIKKKYDDASYKREPIKPWSDLNHDVLLLVMMRLGFVDFLSFSRVCKAWRSLTVSNRNKFIVSRPPMSISISNDANEKGYHCCYLEDFKRRKVRTILPHSANRTCVGVTCGYLILFGKKSKDFWLVNLITRHELHFPNVSCGWFYMPDDVGAILVYSPSISRWVLVVFIRFYGCSKIWFCIVGEREWNFVSTPFSPIYDLIAFKGKIYTLHSNDELKRRRICEIKLYPEPKVVSLETKNFLKPYIVYPEFVTSGENLYVIDKYAKDHLRIHEIDVDEMKWVSSEKKTGEGYAFFYNKPKRLLPYYGRYVVADTNGKGGLFCAEMWYFFFDCLNVDLIHE